MHTLTIKKLLTISLGLLAINLLLTIILFNLDNSTYEHLNGDENEPQSFELVRTVVFGQIISVPILSLLIGLIIAIFVDKNLPFSKRIFRSFLLTLTTIYGLYTLMGLVRVITFL